MEAGEPSPFWYSPSSLAEIGVVVAGDLSRRRSKQRPVRREREPHRCLGRRGKISGERVLKY